MTVSPSGPLSGAPGAPDPDEFAEFWRAEYSRLRRYVAAKYGESDADDIVRETMVRAYNHWHSFDRDPRSWLHVVAKHVWIDLLRARARREHFEGEHGLPLPEVQQPEDAACRAEMRADVRRAMNALTPRERMVLKKFYWDETPSAQIAELFGVRDGAVRQTLIRARRRLRDEYCKIADSALAAFLPVLAWAHRWARRATAAPASVSAAGGVCCLSLVLSIGGSGVFGELLHRHHGTGANSGAVVALDVAASSVSLGDPRDAVAARRPSVAAASTVVWRAPAPPAPPDESSTWHSVGPVKVKNEGDPIGGSSQRGLRVTIPMSDGQEVYYRDDKGTGLWDDVCAVDVCDVDPRIQDVG
jgi:RNA polymerase sigma-70 factor (ECF subfamily)